MRTKIHKSDKKFFNTQGKGKAKSYSLIYKQGNKEESIVGIVEKPYALCQWKKKELKREPQYKTGTFIIRPNY